METNVSDSLLYIYEYREAYGRLYGIIFVAILIIFGLTVNAVFLVTYFHIRSTVRSGNIVYYELLLYLALLDLLTCAGVMPVDALQQRYMFTLYSDSGCRIQQFLKVCAHHLQRNDDAGDRRTPVQEDLRSAGPSDVLPSSQTRVRGYCARFHDATYTSCHSNRTCDVYQVQYLGSADMWDTRRR